MRSKLVMLLKMILISCVFLSCQFLKKTTKRNQLEYFGLDEIGKSKNRYSIGIGTIYSENYSNFADIGVEINELYALRHGYTFISDKSLLVDTNEFTLHWSKYPFVAKHVKDFDYFVWIDADAVFMKQDRRLEDFIDFYKNDIIVSDDMWWDYEGNMNTGVIIFKGGDWSFDLLNHMMVADICKPYHKNNYHDQTCLELMRSTNYMGAKDKIRIIDHQPFQGPQKDGFIYHMANTKDKAQIENKFKEILEQMQQGS